MQGAPINAADAERTRPADGLLQNVLDNLPCGLSVFDRDLRLVAYNAQFRTLLVLPDHLFDTPVTTFESIIRHNALRGEYGDGPTEETIRAIVERARNPVSHHFRRTRPDGVTLDIHGAPMPLIAIVKPWYQSIVQVPTMVRRTISRSADTAGAASGTVRTASDSESSIDAESSALRTPTAQRHRSATSFAAGTN